MSFMDEYLQTLCRSGGLFALLLKLLLGSLEVFYSCLLLLLTLLFQLFFFALKLLCLHEAVKGIKDSQEDHYIKLKPMQCSI